MPQIDLGQVVGAQGPQGIQGPQGAQGIQGPAGPAATINGVNALTIEAGANIGLAQEGGTATLSVQTDAVPTEDSTKPVQSGGVLEALNNKAPAGYGLGADAALASDFNQAVLSGWYACSGSSNGPTESFYGWLLVSSRNGASSMIRQDAWSSVSQPEHFVRYAVNGVWTPWEYIDPPMSLGVEYRTTERFNGKPVYAKLIDLGAAVNGAVIEAVDSTKRIIRISLGKGKPNIFPVGGYETNPVLGPYDVVLASDGRNIKIFAGSNAASAGGNQISVEVFYIDA